MSPQGTSSPVSLLTRLYPTRAMLRRSTWTNEMSPSSEVPLTSETGISTRPKLMLPFHNARAMGLSLRRLLGMNELGFLDGGPVDRLGDARAPRLVELLQSYDAAAFRGLEQCANDANVGKSFPSIGLGILAGPHAVR